MRFFKIAVFFFFLLTQVQGETFAFAQEFSYHRQWQNTFEQAKKKKKPLMVLFVTKTCPWCKKLENQVLSKPEITDFLQKNFILVLLDKDSDAFPSYLEVQVVPTIYFVDAQKEKDFGAIIGYKNKEEFFELIQKAAKRFKGQ